MEVVQITKDFATLLGIGAVVTAIIAIGVFVRQVWLAGKSLYGIAEHVELVPSIKTDLEAVKAQQEKMKVQLDEISDLVCLEGPERTQAIAERQRRHRRELAEKIS